MTIQQSTLLKTVIPSDVSTTPRHPILQSIVYIFAILVVLSLNASRISPKMLEMMFLVLLT